MNSTDSIRGAQTSLTILTHIKVDTEFSASGFSIKTYLRYLVHLALLCCLSAFNFVQC